MVILRMGGAARRLWPGIDESVAATITIIKRLETESIIIAALLHYRITASLPSSLSPLFKQPPTELHCSSLLLTGDQSILLAILPLVLSLHRLFHTQSPLTDNDNILSPPLQPQCPTYSSIIPLKSFNARTPYAQSLERAPRPNLPSSWLHQAV